MLLYLPDESLLELKFTIPPPFDMATTFEDSNCLTPLVFILTPGADPTEMLRKFSEKLVGIPTFLSNLHNFELL